MKTFLVVVAGTLILAGCPTPAQIDPHLDVSFPELVYGVTDGGTDAGIPSIPYQPPGTFTVGVSAKLPGATGPVHATVEIADPPLQPMGATTSAQITLLPPDGGVFPLDLDGGELYGTATLTWPPGGPVNVRASAASASMVVSAPLIVPKLQVNVPSTVQAFAGAGNVISFCVQSSTANGTVTVQLDNATIAGGPNTSSMLALSPGDCVSSEGGPSAPFIVASHALFAAVPNTVPGTSPPELAQQIQITATLGNVTPPILDTKVVNVTQVPVDLKVTSSATSYPAGAAVSLNVAATYLPPLPDGGTGAEPAPNINVTLQSLPGGVSFVPSPIITQADGGASTTFLMPALDGGMLSIEASGAGAMHGLTLTN